MVPPLPQGTRLADRFEVGRVLGRGGFSIVYEVADLRRGDRAVVKEFVPPDATREEGGLLDLGGSAIALRRTFLSEAQTVGRLALPGVLPVRLAFVANATGYVVTDAVEGAKTLDVLLKEGGELDPTGVLDLAYQLIETLEAIHAKGLLHRDVKPSNVLVGPDGRVYLIDFGAARSWTADAQNAHTVVFTPGYAPPEQMAPLARRGPQTDVYGLCATLYAALTGRAPEDATARAGGQPLTPLASLRPDLDVGISEAIEKGLSMRASDRPATMGDLRRLLDEGPGHDALDSLDSLDALLLRARRFVFDRRACPACGGVLEEARPLPKEGCPACQRGRVRLRRLDARACPACRRGVLQPTSRAGGFFARRGAGAGGVCDDCSTAFVALEDGRWRNGKTGRELYPDEWARVAAGLNPDAGNAFCDACDADFDLQGDLLTLLHAPEDPHGFAKAYAGRPLPRERVRWLAVGKRSPHPGFVCDRCDTELDRDGRDLRLIDSPNRRLDRLAGQSRSLESWHRLAEGLPEAGREAELEERIGHALGAAYRRGEVGFGALAWRGPAAFRGRPTLLVAREDGLRLGRGLRARNVPLADLQGLRAEGDWLLAEGPDGPFELQVEPVELVAHLRSGDRSVLLSATDLAARLAWAGMSAGHFRVS